MVKRLSWFLGGAVAGVVGAGVTRKKVRTVAAELSPSNLARKATERAREALLDGKQALKVKQVELRARLTGSAGHAGTLADELEEGATVLVEGRPVEPGKVIVLRPLREHKEAGRHSRRA